MCGMELDSSKKTEKGADDAFCGVRLPRVSPSVVTLSGVAAGLAVMLEVFHPKMTVIVGSSMSPAFSDSEYVLTSRVDQSAIQRFDIVSFKRAEPNEYDDNVSVKRIVALPGETLQLCNGELFINGRLTKQPAHFFHDDNIPEVMVPAGHYFVLGDNRANSEDSRELGFVPAGSIQARVVCNMGSPEQISAESAALSAVALSVALAGLRFGRSAHGSY